MHMTLHHHSCSGINFILFPEHQDMSLEGYFFENCVTLTDSILRFIHRPKCGEKRQSGGDGDDDQATLWL